MKRLIFFSLVSFFFHHSTAQNWKEIKKIVSSDIGAQDEFGYSTAIFQNFAIVGDYGSAYIFKRDVNGNWNEVQKITSTGENGFGLSVAISADYAIVGAPNDKLNEAGKDTLFRAGACYIFERAANGHWNEVQKVVSADREKSDEFGSSVSINENTIFVGARGEDENANGEDSLQYAGSVYIFKKDENGYWVQKQKIVAPDRIASHSHGFGHAISSSGNYLIIGTELGNVLWRSGVAYIFEKVPKDSWNYIQKLEASDKYAIDRFGLAVGICGKYAIVGASWNAEKIAGGGTFTYSGAAYIFERNKSGIWVEIEKIFSDDLAAGDEFGSSVAINDNYIVVGAPHEDEDISGSSTVSLAGSAYIFKMDGLEKWRQIQKIVGSERGEQNRFGYNVVVYGNNILVAAPWESVVVEEDTFNWSGAVYHFRIDLQRGTIEKSIKIYPNPTKGKFIVDLGQDYQDVKITIHTIIGQVLVSKLIELTDKFEIEFQGANGLYILEIQAKDEKSVVRKLIKE